MDIKQGKKYLSRARTLEWEIRDRLEIIEKLYFSCGLQGISYDKISVISSPENKLEKIMAEIDEEKREVEKLRKLQKKAIDDIKDKILELEPSPERTVLMKFYVGCKSMKTISNEIGYELSYCYRKQKEGIKKL